MSEYLATETLAGRIVETVTGLDRCVGDCFLQVFDERHDVHYTSLQEPLRHWSDITTLRAQLGEFGLHPPALWVDAVERAGRRRADNHIVRHQADRTRVTPWAGQHCRVPVNGAALGRQAARFWREAWDGESFMAIGLRDPVFGPDVMRALHATIRRCPPPMEVSEGGHFLQEWGGPIALAALDNFGLSNGAAGRGVRAK